ncbi:UNVERIFIED_CONTAM: hypothetical protein HDU68_007214 [Siphonaria sp. JEL0065]|nr:hypothetical protein HDU68_007214 [Siphonaria sp. JEL0065]
MQKKQQQHVKRRSSKAVPAPVLGAKTKEAAGRGLETDDEIRDALDSFDARLDKYGPLAQRKAKLASLFATCALDASGENLVDASNPASVTVSSTQSQSHQPQLVQAYESALSMLMMEFLTFCERNPTLDFGIRGIVDRIGNYLDEVKEAEADTVKLLQAKRAAKSAPTSSPLDSQNVWAANMVGLGLDRTSPFVHQSQGHQLPAPSLWSTISNTAVTPPTVEIINQTDFFTLSMTTDFGSQLTMEPCNSPSTPQSRWDYKPKSVAQSNSPWRTPGFWNDPASSSVESPSKLPSLDDVSTADSSASSVGQSPNILQNTSVFSSGTPQSELGLPVRYGSSPFQAQSADLQSPFSSVRYNSTPLKQEPTKVFSEALPTACSTSSTSTQLSEVELATRNLEVVESMISGLKQRIKNECMWTQARASSCSSSDAQRTQLDELRALEACRLLMVDKLTVLRRAEFGI